tara:strand:+ start:1536 stop:1682 length:147 start_codon:yes stop_codon:yes gene_type:complete
MSSFSGVHAVNPGYIYHCPDLAHLLWSVNKKEDAIDYGQKTPGAQYVA